MIKSFSVYHISKREAEQDPSTVDLGKVPHVSRQEFAERETLLFSTQVPCMEYLSLLIENAVLLRTNRAGRIYAGFEKLSRLEPIIDRYLRMADVSERVFVFGVDDWTPPRHPHLKTIPVEADSALAREWFVVANSPSYRAALVARDEDGFGHPDLEQRCFSAVKTSSPTQIARLAEAVENSF